MWGTQDDRIERLTRNFRADVRLDLGFVGGEMKAWRAVNAVGVEQRHGGHGELRACCHEFLGHRGAFEKAESRAGMKFDVHQLPVKIQHGDTEARRQFFFSLCRSLP